MDGSVSRWMDDGWMMDGWVDQWVGGWVMDGWISGWMGGSVGGRMGAWTDSTGPAHGGILRSQEKE